MSASSPAAVPQTGTIRLGLIGDNIAASSSPACMCWRGCRTGAR
ncbi:hypothetical protein [Pannonibacter phragmitetus]|nr:hypothetical protein [Pannonibacter phragmitetus]